MLNYLRLLIAKSAGYRPARSLIIYWLIFLPIAFAHGQGDLKVTDRTGNGGFALVHDHVAAGIHVDGNDFAVAHIAADCLAGDISAVTGVKPAISTGTAGLAQ